MGEMLELSPISYAAAFAAEQRGIHLRELRRGEYDLEDGKSGSALVTAPATTRELESAHESREGVVASAGSGERTRHRVLILAPSPK